MSRAQPTVRALLGLGVAVLAGRKLVTLEVANQRVEAELRRDLVVLEATPDTICHAEARDETVASLGHTPPLPSPAPYFVGLWRALRANYEALYRNFLGLNLWLDFFDQVMVVAPYVLVAPLLFAPSAATRITLGTLVQTSNSFGRVFSSLSVLSENWGGINEWRSTYVRLKQFEAELAGRASGCTSITSSCESSEAEMSPMCSPAGAMQVVAKKL